MAQVNVPRDIDDEFYRYKMPVMRAKVEGRGNGIKTVVENCAEISKALDRNAEYVCKFFGFELGALTSNLNDKYRQW
jgi:translation initiation factor 2 beta subunit (eIF-2beta)/eIF-5